MTDEVKQPLMTHLIELRQRLIWVFVAMAVGTGLAYIFVEDILSVLIQPLAQAMGEGDTNRLIYTGLTEAFFTYLKVSFFAGIFITFPVLLWQIYRFIAPGLYKNEKRAVAPFLIATPLLFFFGGALVYFVVMPMAWGFFLSFQSSQTTLPIQLEPRISEYLDLVMTLMFVFGLCFEMPVLFGLLGKAGIIKARHLIGARKYAIVVGFIIGAFLTPPDIISQVALAVPLVLLFEVSILILKCTERHETSRL